MPKLVDHPQRRAEIIEALLELIAAEGMSAVTSRALASRLGVSNGALWRYFSGKEDLLNAAYRTVIENTNRRAAAEMGDTVRLDRVIAMVEALLPLTEVSKLEAKVVVSFWGLAATNPANSAGRAELEDWSRQLHQLLTGCVTAGDLRPDTPTAVLTTMLLSYAVNSQLEYAFHGDQVVTGMTEPIRGLLDAFRA